MKKSFKIG